MESFESQQTNSQLTPGPPATARILSFCSGFSCVFLPGKLFLLAIENNNETAVEFVQAPVHQPVQSWVHGVLQLRINCCDHSVRYWGVYYCTQYPRLVMYLVEKTYPEVLVIMPMPRDCRSAFAPAYNSLPGTAVRAL